MFDSVARCLEAKAVVPVAPFVAPLMALAGIGPAQGSPQRSEGGGGGRLSSCVIQRRDSGDPLLSICSWHHTFCALATPAVEPHHTRQMAHEGCALSSR